MKSLDVLLEKLEALRIKNMKIHIIHFNSGEGQSMDHARAKYLSENKVRSTDFIIFIEVPSNEAIKDRIKKYGKLN